MNARFSHFVLLSAPLPRQEMKICSLSSTHHGPGREVSSCQQPTPPHHTRRLSCLRSQRKNGCLASTDTNAPGIITDSHIVKSAVVWIPTNTEVA